MEEAFFRTHANLVDNTNAAVRRNLMDEIDWSDRLIGIKGTRGVGKTTFLLQYAKEKFGATDRSCLYVNMNNFYFQGLGIAEFAVDFVENGGRVLLIDQVFKQPNWSSELRKCHDLFPNLKIVFTGSSVMRLKEENPELNGIVKSYNLRGFSFREFLNLQTGNDFRPYSLSEILNNHEHIIKTIHMMTEVDILLIKQIELKYLHKIKKLFYLLAVEGPKAPNISNLADEIQTSRATVMNYIKYLADARLINIIYPVGEEFPKKPTKVMMHNSNLMYAIYPITIDDQELMETFFVNSLWKDHIVNQANKDHFYIVDGEKHFRICDAHGEQKIRFSPDTIYARYNTEVGKENQIPLWLFGFLY